MVESDERFPPPFSLTGPLPKNQIPGKGHLIDRTWITCSPLGRGRWLNPDELTDSSQSGRNYTAKWEVGRTVTKRKSQGFREGKTAALHRITM